MNAYRLKSLAAAATTLVAVGVASVHAGAAPTDTVAGAGAAAAQITPTGVGGVTLGATHTSLHVHHLVGNLMSGCELSGPNAPSARLVAPLKGSVDYTLTAPRKVTAITVTGGAQARGAGIGARIPAIRTAFPKAKVDHSTDQMFGLTFVTIPKNGGGKLQFGVSTQTHKVTLIGIPFIPVCE